MAAVPSAVSPDAKDSAFKRVGRFASLGLEHPWQTALIVPTGYEDLREIAEAVEDTVQYERVVIWLRIDGQPSATFSRGIPRTTFQAVDQRGQRVRVAIFGDSKEWIERLSELESAHFLVQPNEYQGEINLRALEIVPDEWVGRLRPKYAGKPNYLAAEKVRDTVIKGLPRSLATAAGFIEQELAPIVRRDRLVEAAGLPGWSLEQVIEETHLPASPRMATTAREALHRIAAFAALAKAHAHTTEVPRARALKLTTWPVRMGALPYTSTPEQRQAVLDIANDMARPKATHRMLIGDVGSGKTSVFGTAAVATVDAGGRVAILLPNLPLAVQVHAEIESAWPDVAPVLVTGDTDADDLEDIPLLIGTTALLHRSVGEFDLVVVDEEQKFGVDQREKLSKLKAHLLTSTATCIPRSLALVKYGAIGLSELRKAHVEKTIITKLWGCEAKRELMSTLKQFLTGNDQLLIVYPMREPGEDLPAMLSVEVAAQAWQKMYPEQVRVLTGADSDEVKRQVMDDMRSGRAKILIATTVVEVGVTLPALRRVMVVAPERYGLVTLHQLRGRAARRGGTGWFDLYSPAPLKEKQQEKLQLFTRCKDGFEVAELDLKLRGFGDLARGGTKQSGADDSFLYGSAITPDHVAPMEELWRAVKGQANPR